MLFLLILCLNGAGSPGLASPRMLGGVKASIYSPRSNANMRLFGQECVTHPLTD
jgi:hypothetical protein